MKNMDDYWWMFGKQIPVFNIKELIHVFSRWGILWMCEVDLTGSGLILSFGLGISWRMRLEDDSFLEEHCFINCQMFDCNI